MIKKYFTKIAQAYSTNNEILQESYPTMAGSDKLLVYRYRAGRTNKNLEVMTRDEVDEEIKKSRSLPQHVHMIHVRPNANNSAGAGSLQQTSKKIDGSVVTIKEKDLRTEEQQKAWASKPNSEAEVASVKIPMLKKMLGGFKELTILSEAKVVTEQQADRHE